MRTFLAFVLLFVATSSHAQGAPERWRLVEELRIGSVDGPNTLTGVHALVVSPNGREIFVGQHTENLVRVFDATSGKFVRTIGRRGQGPGEFNWMGEMGWKGDTLVIRDRALNRISLFSAEGQHLRTENDATAPAASPDVGPAVPFAYLANGTLVGSTYIDMHAVLLGRMNTAKWVQMSREGKVIRTLAESGIRGKFNQIWVGNRGFVFAQPMSDTVFLRVSPNGSTIIAAYASPTMDPDARYRVVRLDVNGNTVYDHTFLYKPVPLSKRLEEETLKPYEENFRGAPPAKVKAAIREGVRLPSALPPITTVNVGPDGTTWVGRGELRPGTEYWVVLDPAGTLRATVEVPKGVRIKAISDDVVWAEVKDAQDVPYVVRYRIRRTP